MALPRCKRCGNHLSYFTGLPVGVSFDNDATVATIYVDTSELSDDLTEHIGCSGPCLEPELEDEAVEWFDAALTWLGKNYAPEVDASLPDEIAGGPAGDDGCAMFGCADPVAFKYADVLTSHLYCDKHARQVAVGAIDRGEAYSLDPLVS